MKTIILVMFALALNCSFGQQTEASTVKVYKNNDHLVYVTNHEHPRFAVATPARDTLWVDMSNPSGAMLYELWEDKVYKESVWIVKVHTTEEFIAIEDRISKKTK